MKPARRQRFWLISGGVHIAVLIALIVSPVGEHIFRRDVPERPEVARHGDELARVVDNIRDLTAERLRTQVALLEAGQQRMATNFTVLNKHYQPRAEAQAAVARVRFTEQAAAVLTRQRAVLAAASSIAADPESAGILANVLGEHQARLTTGLEEIRRGVHLLASDRTDLLDELRSVEEEQLNAFQFLGWVRDAHQSLERYRERTITLTRELAEAEAQFAEASEALSAAQAALKSAREAQNAASDDAARSEARTRLQEADRAQHDAFNRKSSASGRRDHLTNEAAQITEHMAGHVTNRAHNAGIAYHLQNSATTRQTAVVDAVNAILATESAP